MLTYNFIIITMRTHIYTSVVLCGDTYRTTITLSKVYIKLFVINCRSRIPKIIIFGPCFWKIEAKMCVALIFVPHGCRSTTFSYFTNLMYLYEIHTVRYGAVDKDFSEQTKCHRSTYSNLHFRNFSNNVFSYSQMQRIIHIILIGWSLYPLRHFTF